MNEHNPLTVWGGCYNMHYNSTTLEKLVYYKTTSLEVMNDVY